MGARDRKLAISSGAGACGGRHSPGGDGDRAGDIVSLLMPTS